ncbi:MAG: hypothetical protein HFI30_15640 [Lachnospiraceae bacterium]|nr:hypothetical protein [Lachnospiraceae bacterium]
MKEEKRKRIEESRREIRHIVQNYVNREAKGNQGQLKFLEGLITGNLAVSIGITLRKDERFWNYLEDYFLKDHQDCLSYFDEKKNLEEFANSPYGMDTEKLYEGFCPGFPIPPYLLLRRAQEVMEQACVFYIQLPREELDEEEPDNEKLDEEKLDEEEPDEEEIWEELFEEPDEEEVLKEEEELPEALAGKESPEQKRKTQRRVRPKTKKKEAYVEWLFSIAIYEIFLIEYGRRLPKRRENPQDERELEALEKLYPEIFCYEDEEKLKEQIDEFWERAGKYYHKLQEDMLRLYCENCYFLHLIHLCAMLRVVAQIEFVRVSRNMSSENRKGRDMTALTEAVDFLHREARWKNCYLFTDVKNSRNLDAYAKRFRRMYQSFQISPHLSGEESWDEHIRKSLRNDRMLHQYLAVIRAGKRRRNPEELERELWMTSIEFAQPVIKALDAIGGLKE